MKDLKHEPVANWNGDRKRRLSIWIGCSCGWNIGGDEDESWREHFARTMTLEELDEFIEEVKP